MNKNLEIKNQLQEYFRQFEKTPPPKGFVSACNDVDVDVYQYASDTAGLVSSYFEGITDIHPAMVDLGEEIDRKLTECEVKLRELKQYKRAASELASILVKCLSE